MAVFASMIISHDMPKAVVMLGIAGRIDTDLRVGDVVVAEEVWGWTEELSIEDARDQAQKEIIAHNLDSAGREMTRYTVTLCVGGQSYEVNAGPLTFWRATHRASYERWAATCAERIQLDSIPENLRPLVRDFREDTDHKLSFGRIASGEIVAKASVFGHFARDKHRKLAAVEMEAAGLLKVLKTHRNNNVKRFVIRGISDPADPRKTDLDKVRAPVRDPCIVRICVHA